MDAKAGGMNESRRGGECWLAERMTLPNQSRWMDGWDLYNLHA